MLLLAIDSTARAASAAVSRDGHILASMQIDTGNTHSEHLLPMIENCLERAGLTLPDLDAYACTSGPGSFTGVRIGVSVIKGLAFGTDKPCIAVSALEAIAQSLLSLNGLYCAVMDARRSQVYTALFDTDENGCLRRLTDDDALSLAELAELISHHLPRYNSLFLAGDGYDVATKALKEMGIFPSPTPPLLRLQNASSVCAVAERVLEKGELMSDRSLSPLYLRLPQAERERLQKEQQQNTVPVD